MKNRHTLALTHIGVAIAAFAVASCMGVLQAMSIADVDFPQRNEPLYYESVTAHGVLMALVFTTFFIMGLGYVFARGEPRAHRGPARSVVRVLAGRGRDRWQRRSRLCSVRAPCCTPSIRRSRRIPCSTLARRCS